MGHAGRQAVPVRAVHVAFARAAIQGGAGGGGSHHRGRRRLSPQGCGELSMAEAISRRYQRLFDVWLLHHYWLDDGRTLFDKLSDTKRTGRLQGYDARSLLTVVPTTATAHSLSGFRCLFRQSALGFTVVAPANAVIPADTVLEFVVAIQAAEFFDYTALTLRGQKIHDLFNPLDGAVYRYKENV